MPNPANVNVQRHADHLVVRIELDHLDEMNIEEVRSSVEVAAAESPKLPVFLDMSRVYFMVSLSLGEFVELSQQFKGRGQRLVLTNLQAPVRQVIAITRLDKLFEIQEVPSGSPG
jgi:anti-anti-sigma factor